jgi:hypothetical protein
MSMDVVAAGTVLAEVLEAENAALATLDLPRAARLLEDKQRALAGLTGAAPAPPVANAAAGRLAHRLQALALENKRLLERAIAAQGRVMSVVARAATPAVPAGYGTARPRRPVALAVSTRV